MTDGIQTWTGISGSADRPKSLQIEPVEYLKTLKNVLTQSVKNNEYQVMIAPRKKAVVLTIKLQQLHTLLTYSHLELYFTNKAVLVEELQNLFP